VATSRNTLSANQEISHILWNTKVHYHVHDNQPFVRILSHTNSVHPTPSHLISLRPHIHTYLLTPWSTVLLEKLTGYELVKKFPTYDRTRKFTSAFTRARTCPHSEPDTSSPCPPSHFLKIYFNIILSSMPGSSK
jgi:hypothetical protein